jgi:hypothetical protein
MTIFPQETVDSPPPFRWATVTQVSPLRIRLDGDTTALPMTPENLAGSVGVGSRVLVQFLGRRVLVVALGAGNGSTYMEHAREVLRGGGVRLCNTTGVSWSARLIAINAGRSILTPSGYHQIDMPADGTVITRHSNSAGTTSTVAGGFIPVQTWEALYYDLPLSGFSTSDSSRFHLVGYNATPTFEVPDNWVFIVGRTATASVDAGSVPYKWFDGREQDVDNSPTLGNGWANYGLGYKNATYRKDNGFVTVEGLVKSGTFSTGSTGTIFTLPAGYLPGAQHIFNQMSDVGHARVDVLTTGEVRAMAAYNGGSNNWVSLAGIRFRAVA